MPDENPAARSVPRASPGDGAPELLIDRCVCGSLYPNPIHAYGLELAACGYCGTWHQRIEGLKPADIDAYYDGRYHRDDDRHFGQLGYEFRYGSDRVAAKARLKAYQAMIGTLPEGVILDVGCGNCAFVDELHEHGKAVVGIDPDPVFISGPRDYVLTGRIRDRDMGVFGVITYHDVVEHLVDPIAELTLAKSMLLAGAILIVEIPDVFVPEGAKHFKREHLWYFSTDGLELMGAALNLCRIAHYSPIPGKRTIVWRRT